MPALRSSSPLRYPGGKQVLTGLLAHLIRINNASGGTYVEPYAGGAGAALNLLFGEHVNRIVINDADPAIYALWRALLERTDEFVDLVKTVPLSVAEWRRQREIYSAGRQASLLRFGFATFYLNRCNRSGVIASGGPIGGLEQDGPWKIDARFNRNDLVQRIERVASYARRIEVTNLDATEFLLAIVNGLDTPSRVFAYLDPPYFAKAEDLYLNYYKADDHRFVAKFIRAELPIPWLLSYDDVPEIRRLYAGYRTVPLALNYSAKSSRKGSELLILKPGLAFPREWRNGVAAGALYPAGRG